MDMRNTSDDPSRRGARDELEGAPVGVAACRAASLGASLVGLSVLLTGCLTSFEPPSQLRCVGDDDCPAGMGCAEEVGLCLERCSTSTDCPTLAFRCEGGLCVPVVAAECAAHEECDSPEACEASADASCIEGQCAYPPMVCDTPPTRECSQDDQWIRVWAAMGTCEATGMEPGEGRCEYPHTDVPCPDCTVNCLEQDPCEGFSCPDEAGGCLVHGVCLPTNPPSCAFQTAPVNTPCDRMGSPTGSQDGFCNEGICGGEVLTPCEQNTECAPQSCIAGYCRPLAGFQGICDSEDDADCGPLLECAGLVCLRVTGESCQQNEDCAGTCIALHCAPASGVNGPCDAADGGDDDDCQTTLHCNSGVCGAALACVDNSVCTGGDVCIGGYCRAPASTGGACDPGEDGDCVTGNACVAGVCLRVNGQTCGSNSQCVNVCIANLCDDPGGTLELCDPADGAADCLSGRTCSSGLCLLLDGQTGCTNDDQCLNTCIDGTCGPRVGTGSPCDSVGDCLTGNTCSGGLCLRVNGQSCSSNSQCEYVCIGGICSTQSGTLGACDLADGNADCLSGRLCVGGVCLLEDGRLCSSNTQCVNTCVSSTCAPLGGTGAVCDSGDSGDCLTTHSCVGGRCLAKDGQSCTSNGDCVNSCIEGSCAPISGLGGPCDDFGDCQSPTVCVGHQCMENGIARIHVSGATGSGGGNDLEGWSLVGEYGDSVQSLSVGTAQSLYETINWTASLTRTVRSGEYFALVGGESSSAVTRTFTFYDGLDQQIDQLVIDLDNTIALVRTFSVGTDDWIRFSYDGSHVTYKKFHKPIARIRVTGVSEPSGGGSPLSGWYRVSDSGANLGQISPGHTQTLYALSSWEVALTTPIQEAWSFALVGSEGSAAITRTFTFLDASSNTINQVTVNSTFSNDIIRTNTFNSGDVYVHFTYADGLVTSASRTSP